jgi:peptidoglycan/LPS O-acetylase OafA/YrhL
VKSHSAPGLSKRHPNTFDFLRLVAAVAVVLAHSQDLLGTNEAWRAIAWPIQGVEIFFVISGMLVFKSAENSLRLSGGFREYARNRWLRVAPAILSFALILPVILAVLTEITWVDLMSLDILIWLGSALVLAPNHNPEVFAATGFGNVNAHLYTIPAEVSYYVLVPFLIWIAGRCGFGRMLLIALPVAVAAPAVAHSIQFGIIPRILDHTFLELFAYFLAGVFWARYWKLAPKHWTLFLGSLVVLIGLRLLLADVELYRMFQPVILSIPLSYAVVWFGYKGPGFLSKVTEKIGDLSFGTYIWHVPVIYLFLYWGLDGAWWVTPAVLFFSLAVASVSWRFVEQPFLRRKRVSERVVETGESIPGAAT